MSPSVTNADCADDTVTSPPPPAPSTSAVVTPSASSPDAIFTPSFQGETLKFANISARVKRVDVHPTKRWLLSALYDGRVLLHDMETKSLVMTFQVSDSAVRVARFVPSMDWIVTGSDDHKVRVFHVKTGDKLAEFEAHDDYVRDLQVHSTKPLVFTAGDDQTIKVWDWSQEWRCVRVLTGHSHYAMALALSPSGNNLATVSLDHSVRLWGIADADDAVSVNATLHEAHTRGLNDVTFTTTGASFITASDDRTLRVWDVATKRTVAVLHGHTHNVTSVAVHPTKPLILSGSEDGSVRLWNSTTYRCEGVWTHGLGRAWTIVVLHDTNTVAIGYDRGTVVVELPSSLTTTTQSAAEGFVDVADA